MMAIFGHSTYTQSEMYSQLLDLQLIFAKRIPSLSLYAWKKIKKKLQSSAETTLKPLFTTLEEEWVGVLCVCVFPELLFSE